MTLCRDDRIAKMKSMRFNRLMTLQEIGDEFGISRERVRQIIGNTGYKVIKDRTRERNIKIRDAVTKTNFELSESFDITESKVASIRSDIYHKVNGGSRGKGQKAEMYVHQILNGHGIKNKLMPLSHGFDILALDEIKIDVKSAFTTVKLNPKINSPQWHFSLKANTRGRYCDIFICVIWESKDCFIIPYDILDNEKSDMGDLAFCWPTERPEIGKYQKYHNRWDLIEQIKRNNGINIKNDVYLGRSIKRIRKSIGMSRSELSELSGVKITTIIQIENRPTKRPTDDNLNPIMSALNVTMADLLEVR